MRPLAENHVQITKEIFEEYFNAINARGYRKTMKKIAIGLLIVFGAVAVFLVAGGVNPFYLVSQSFFAVVILIWLFYFLPKSRRKSSYAAICRRSGSGTPMRSILFFEDNMVVTSQAEKSLTIEYEDIAELTETEHLYAVISKEKRCVLIDKNGFTKGNAETMKAAIGAKNPAIAAKIQ